MTPLSVFAQTAVDPLANAYDGIDPLRWLPAWRHTWVNDVWSHRGGGIFNAVKNAGLGILDIFVTSGFFLASLLWEITTTMLSWALTPSLFEAFEDVVDTTGLKLLDALGFTTATNGATMFAAIVVLAVVVAVTRFARNPAAGVKTLLRSFLPLAACAVLVGTSVAEINRTALGGAPEAAVPGSLKWMYRTLDTGRSLLVAGVVESAALFSSVGDPPGTVYGCDSYLQSLEDLYRQDARAAGWRGAQIETPIVVSRMWQAVYLDQFSAAQVGIHSSKRAGCWTAEVREKSVDPIEIFAVWDHTCNLDAEHHLYGCDPNRVYDSAEIQRAEAVFAPSDFDDHEWRSALTLWAVCDWRGRPSNGLISGRSDLLPGAQRTLREMATSHDVIQYDSKTLRMLTGGGAIFDPAFVGLRNARDSEKYLSAEACAAYRFEHPEPGKVQTPNEDRDGAWGLWAKWVTDRANIEPHDAADSRRHALGVASATAPDSKDRNIQTDTVDSINGSSWTGRLMHSVFAVLTAALYGFSLAGMGLGTLIAQFIVGGIVAVLPLLLVLMALPVQAAQQLPRKVFKLLIASLFAHLIFLFVLSLTMMFIGILNQVLGGLTGSHFMRSMLFSVVPLIALFGVAALAKQFNLKIISPKGAALAAAGIALVGMRQPNLGIGQYAHRARSRYDQISDRAAVNREVRGLEARSGESNVRTQPRMRAPAPDTPALALNSKASPAAVAAGALATMGGRIPKGTHRGPGSDAIPKWPAPTTTPTKRSADPAQQGAEPSRLDPLATPARVPVDSPVPAGVPSHMSGQVVTAPESDRAQPEPARAAGGMLGGRIRLDGPPPAQAKESPASETPSDEGAPTAVVAPPQPPPARPGPRAGPDDETGDRPPVAAGGDTPGGEQTLRTEPRRLGSDDATDTATTAGENTGTVAPARRHRLTESVESAAVRVGRAAKAAQWGALKGGRWVRGHRRAIKRVALGSIIAMGAVGMSAAAAPLAVGYAGAKFVGWRYRRQLQALHLARSPEERAQERVDRRQQRETKRQDRELRVEQRMRRRAEERSPTPPPARPRPPTSVVAPRPDLPPTVTSQPGGPAAVASPHLRLPDIPSPSPTPDTTEPSPEPRTEPEPSEPEVREPEPADSPRAPSDVEPAPSPDPAPTPQAGSPTEMTAAQAGYLASLSESAGLDPSAVFEAVAGNRVRASEAIDVLRSGAPPDGTAGSLMDRVTDVTSRVRLPGPTASDQDIRGG